MPECVAEDRWLQLSSVERTIYNRTFAALETSVRQSGLLRQKNRNTMEAAARRFKTWTIYPCLNCNDIQMTVVIKSSLL